MYIMAAVIGLVIGAAGGTGDTAGFLGFIIVVGVAIPIAFQAVKRLHDLGRPGSHYWLFLIPFYGIYLCFVLLFKKGTDGSNPYGPDPLTQTLEAAAD
jgi:uncharacterized membrane protein YhaH (DUF805 family)